MTDTPENPNDGTEIGTAYVSVVGTTPPTNIFSVAFVQYAGERAIKTAAQTALAGVTVTGLTGILDVAWLPLLGTVGLATVASVLTSIVTITSRNVGD